MFGRLNSEIKDLLKRFKSVRNNLLSNFRKHCNLFGILKTAFFSSFVRNRMTIVA